MLAFLTSTKSPILTLFPILLFGLKYAYGPTVVFSPTVLSTIVELCTSV